jgi:hypothetical protein
MHTTKTQNWTREHGSHHHQCLPPASRGLVFRHRQQFFFLPSPCPCCCPVLPTGKWQDGRYHLQCAHAATLRDEFSLLQQCMPSPPDDTKGSIPTGHIVPREICMRQGKLREMGNGGARKRVCPRTLKGTTRADNNPTLQYSRAIKRAILIDRDGSIKWHRRKKKSGCKLPSSQNQLFSKLFFFTSLDVCHDITCIHHCDLIPFFGWSYGTFPLTENPMLKAQAFAVPPWCKRKTILSAAH